ncbi:MAG: twin-arginine translocation signal domain-containing protein [Candidatus Binatia bacterium]
MRLTRRSFLKAGVVAGAAMVIPPTELFAQAAPLLRKKIPSSVRARPAFQGGSRQEAAGVGC